MHPHHPQSPTPRIYNFPSTNCNDAVRMRNVQNTYHPRTAAFEPLSRLLPTRCRTAVPYRIIVAQNDDGYVCMSAALKPESYFRKLNSPPYVKKHTYFSDRFIFELIFTRVQYDRTNRKFRYCLCGFVLNLIDVCVM